MARHALAHDDRLDHALDLFEREQDATDEDCPRLMLLLILVGAVAAILVFRHSVYTLLF